MEYSKKDDILTRDELLEAIQGNVRLATDSANHATMTMLRQIQIDHDKLRNQVNSICRIEDKLDEFVKRCEPVINAFETQKIVKDFLASKGAKVVKFSLGVSAISTVVALVYLYVISPIIRSVIK